MPDDLILETRDVAKEFRGFVAVAGVSLKVKRGSIHGLIGPNGAGKTTMFNLLTRFLPVTRGSIFHRGEDVTHTAPPRGGALLPDLGRLRQPDRSRERAHRAAAPARHLLPVLGPGSQPLGPRR